LVFNTLLSILLLWLYTGLVFGGTQFESYLGFDLSWLKFHSFPQYLQENKPQLLSSKPPSTDLSWYWTLYLLLRTEVYLVSVFQTCSFCATCSSRVGMTFEGFTSYYICNQSSIVTESIWISIALLHILVFSTKLQAISFCGCHLLISSL
jgi:hypothetical protein